MAEARLTLAHKTQGLHILQTTNQASVHEIQEEAAERLIPTLQKELALDDTWREWAEGYVDDEGEPASPGLRGELTRLARHDIPHVPSALSTISVSTKSLTYRQKHGFSKSATLSALRFALLLPLPLATLSTTHPSLTLTFSPPSPPTLHVCLTYLTPSSLASFKQTLLFLYERIRLYLADEGGLGFYCVLDLGGARVRDIVRPPSHHHHNPPKLISAAPRSSSLVLHGPPAPLPLHVRSLYAPVPSPSSSDQPTAELTRRTAFIINYTWVYGGLWAVVRCAFHPARVTHIR